MAHIKAQQAEEAARVAAKQADARRFEATWLKQAGGINVFPSYCACIVSVLGGRSSE